MAWLVVNKNNQEVVFSTKPFLHLEYGIWNDGYPSHSFGTFLPKGSIEKLIGHKLSWNDEPVELKEN
jgi:hypothetical protein